MMMHRSLIVLLVMLLLPWGALGASVPVVDTGDVSVESPATIGHVAEPAKRQCTTGIVSAASCSLYIAKGAVFVTRMVPPAAADFPTAADWWVAGDSPAPPTGPPRFS